MTSFRKFVLSKPGTLDNLRVVEDEVPTPGPGQVLVRIRAASLNFRDLLVVQGLYPTPLIEDLVPLSDGAGEVVALGAGATRWSIGDRVCGIFTQTWQGGRKTQSDFAHELGGSVDGVLGEYRLFDENGLVLAPAHLSFEEAATLPCAAVTAWNALFGGRPVRAGEDVLVLGTGGVSSFALQFARMAGARVIALSSSDAKLARFAAAGADACINYSDHPDWPVEVRRLTGGRGVDHVVEVGGPGTLERSLASAALNGQVHLIGVLTQGQINPLPVLGSAITLRGILVGSREMFADMNRAIGQHHIHPLVDSRFEFEDAVSAYVSLQGAGHIGKIVVGLP